MSEIFEKFKEFWAEAEKRLDKKIKLLQLDLGGKYLSNDYDNYLLDNGILSQLSISGMPHQNGVAKKRNRTLLDMVKSMTSYFDLPKF